ncbi:hypothetical protein APHAL10511_002954 [Amanita phalloides]|nr:hypothetical protein APHAL10511_002954 [Amanita phalloides]
MASPLDIQVAVLSPSTTGELVLPSRLHEHVFSRRVDGKSFRFLVSSLEPSASLERVDHVLVEFDLSNSTRVAAMEASSILKEREEEASEQRCTIVAIANSPYETYSDTHLLVVDQEASARDSGFNYVTLNTQTGQGFQELYTLIADKFRLPAPPFYYSYKVYARQLTGRASTWALDKFASLFALPVPTAGNQDTKDDLQLDDETVDALANSAQYDDFTNRQKIMSDFGTCSTYQISPLLAAKALDEDERVNMIFVRKHTSIPVPQPRFHHLRRWLIMDLVKGQTLWDCWGKLNWFTKFRIACTLRGYVSQLRRVTSDRPCSITSGRILRGPLFYDCESAFSFSSSRRLQLWSERVARQGWCRHVRRKLELMQSGQTCDPISPLPVIGRDDEWSRMVFVHGDLNPSNIILSDDGTLWIIDWGSASFLPRSAEYAAVAEPDIPDMWKEYGWLITGRDSEMEHFWGFFSTYIQHYL